MAITEIGNYLISRDNLGIVNSINKIDNGASLLYNPQTKEFDEDDEMTIELRAWEAENGALDLSDFQATFEGETSPSKLAPPDEPPPPDDGGSGENMIL